MNSVQESKNELEAAIRYAENAISSAKQTIESMEFRQEMAQKQYSEHTGREQALERDLSVKTSQAEAWKKEYEKVKAQVKLLEERIADMTSDMVGDANTINNLKAQVNALEQPEKPTMPVIPKAVAIAIFREGVQHGVEAACTELEGQSIHIDESEYVGDFHITFERDIDLNDHIDTDWMRDKCGDYSEERVIDALGNLCADKGFECRIHGIDDNNNEQNSTT